MPQVNLQGKPGRNPSQGLDVGIRGLGPGVLGELDAESQHATATRFGRSPRNGQSSEPAQVPIVEELKFALADVQSQLGQPFEEQLQRSDEFDPG